MFMRPIAPLSAGRALGHATQRFIDELLWQRALHRLETPRPVPPAQARKAVTPRKSRRRLEPHLGRWVDISV